MKLVFDIGLYDGADTAYYLADGYRVLAVEANPTMVERARRAFRGELASGRLILVHGAVAEHAGQPVTLTIAGDDPGASSIFADRIADRAPIGSYTVAGITIGQLIDSFGVPYFLKVDIEAADRFCILPLTPETRPAYLSCEINEDVEELVGHLQAIGFTRFKAVNQLSFLALDNERQLARRARLKLIHMLGFKEPKYVRIGGRFFAVGHSAGPAPWAGDGRWHTAEAFRALWQASLAWRDPAGWYDLHAM